MTISPYTPVKSIRCNQHRRLEDRAIDDLCKTFSTPNCHSCLEKMTDAVFLLDNDRRIMYATLKVTHIINRLNIPFALMQKFTLPDAHNASRFAAFVNEKNTETKPLCLLLEGESNHDKLLLTCFRLAKPTIPNLQVARHRVTLRDSNDYPVHQWQFFTEQFTLTQAKSRLCHDLADGLTLNDYCHKWHITICTARSQLSSVFSKTTTRRQTELLRLIYFVHARVKI